MKILKSTGCGFLILGIVINLLPQSTSIVPNLPPASGNANQYLNGIFQWGTPSGGGSGSAPVGTVVTNGTGSANDIAAFITPTNITKATSAQIQAALGQVYQGTNTKSATIPALGSGSTNLVVDYLYSDLYLETSTNMNLASFGNTATHGSTTVGTILTILANGGNVIVNSGLGSIKVANASVAFPVTITNGDWGVFSFKSYGSNATNNGVAFSFIH